VHGEKPLCWSNSAEGLLAQTSHVVHETPIRVVCANILSLALEGRGRSCCATSDPSAFPPPRRRTIMG
jgi:hypothetical protein